MISAAPKNWVSNFIIAEEASKSSFIPEIKMKLIPIIKNPVLESRPIPISPAKSNIKIKKKDTPPKGGTGVSCEDL